MPPPSITIYTQLRISDYIEVMLGGKGLARKRLLYAVVTGPHLAISLKVLFFLFYFIFFFSFFFFFFFFFFFLWMLRLPAKVPSRYFVGAFWFGFAVKGRCLFEKNTTMNSLKQVRLVQILT